MGPIVVAGESLVDLIVDPAGGLRPALGGGPYNTARTIGRLGGEVAFLGCISRDPFGERLLQGLTEDGVDLGLAARTESPSTLALAELDTDSVARYRFYVDGTAAPELTEAMALQALAWHPWAMHVGTLGLIFEPIGTSLETLIGHLPHDTLVMLDPNARPSATPDLPAWRARIARLGARASVVRVTTDDLAVIEPGRDPLVAAAALLGLGPALVLLTDGVHGRCMCSLVAPPRWRCQCRRFGSWTPSARVTHSGVRSWRGGRHTALGLGQLTDASDRRGSDPGSHPGRIHHLHPGREPTLRPSPSWAAGTERSVDQARDTGNTTERRRSDHHHGRRGSFAGRPSAGLARSIWQTSNSPCSKPSRDADMYRRQVRATSSPDSRTASGQLAAPAARPMPPASARSAAGATGRR